MVFTAKELRAEAWSKLSGKWGTMVIVFIIYSLIVSAASATLIGGLLLMGPMSLGVIMLTIKVVRQEEFEISELFHGFDNFGTAAILYITNSIFIGLWSCLFVIPGIVKTYSYAMSYYILSDNPELTASEARRRSMEMMKGYKWKLFCLHFSFLGWMLLSILTFGILMLWVTPYMQTAEAAFYERISGRANEAEYSQPEFAQ